MSDKYLEVIRGWWRQLLKWLLSMGRKEPEPKIAVVGRSSIPVLAAEAKPAPVNPPRRHSFFESRIRLHMPKFQPCPDCRAKSKRQEKTMGGAYYRCRTHAEFFVGAG